MMLAIFGTVLGLLSIISAEPPVNQGFGGHGQGQGSSQYGPPQAQPQQKQQQSSPQQESSYQSQQMYGPPGHTPGQPLGLSGSGGYEQPQPQSQSCPPNDPQFNLDLVKRVYQQVFGDHDASNLDKYFVQDFIQHNPRVGDGIEGFRTYLMGPFGQGPIRKVAFERVAVDGDFVWTHSRFPFGDKIFAVVDIFRIKCGKIQEHWDVLQDTAVMSLNPHPFF